MVNPDSLDPKEMWELQEHQAHRGDQETVDPGAGPAPEDQREVQDPWDLLGRRDSLV